MDVAMLCNFGRKLPILILLEISMELAYIILPNQAVPWLRCIGSWYFPKLPVGVPGEPDALTGNTCLVVSLSF